MAFGRGSWSRAFCMFAMCLEAVFIAIFWHWSGACDYNRFFLWKLLFGMSGF